MKNVVDIRGVNAADKAKAHIDARCICEQKCMEALFEFYERTGLEPKELEISFQFVDSSEMVGFAENDIEGASVCLTADITLS